MDVLEVDSFSWKLAWATSVCFPVSFVIVMKIVCISEEKDTNSYIDKSFPGGKGRG